MVYHFLSILISSHNRDIVYTDKNKFALPQCIFVSEVAQWTVDGPILFDHMDDKKRVHVARILIACNVLVLDWRNQGQ